MNQQTTEQNAPSKEDMIKWMEEQIQFKKIQLELQKLDTEIAVQRAEYMKAMYTIAQISSPSDGNVTEHTLTEEDMEANPDLKEQGFNVGDVVGVPVEEKQPPLTAKRGLKK